MLDKAGTQSAAETETDVRYVVATFRRFAALSVEDALPPDEDGDGVLAQFGTYEFRGQREFSADFTRQLIGVGENAPTWQLSCTLYWDPSVGHRWAGIRTPMVLRQDTRQVLRRGCRPSRLGMGAEQRATTPRRRDQVRSDLSPSWSKSRRVTRSQARTSPGAQPGRHARSAACDGGRAGWRSTVAGLLVVSFGAPGKGGWESPLLAFR